MADKMSSGLGKKTITKPLTAKCDYCGKLTKVEYKEEKHPNDIRETYFKCEHCFYHYTCFVTDKKVRELQRKRENLKGPHNALKRLELFEEIRQRMTR